jgi:hypothetical protein
MRQQMAGAEASRRWSLHALKALQQVVSQAQAEYSAWLECCLVRGRIYIHPSVLLTIAVEHWHDSHLLHS